VEPPSEFSVFANRPKLLFMLPPVSRKKVVGVERSSCGRRRGVERKK
jgi:hypothetical protein